MDQRTYDWCQTPSILTKKCGQRIGPAAAARPPVKISRDDARSLNNIRERLALHFDVEANLKSQVIGSSYQVTINIPYTKKFPNLTNPLTT